MTYATKAEIRRLLRYDPDTGIFYWRDLRKRKKLTAGSRGKDGYVRIMINYRMYSAAQLAWILYYDEWPACLVDHRDRNPSNNRIDNLRQSNYSMNAHNTGLRSDNTHGVKGLALEKRTGKWMARIGKKHIGTFPTKEAAIAARMEAEDAITYS